VLKRQLVAGIDDFAVMGQLVEERRGHLPGWLLHDTL
jgi:hypothetical protein